MTVSLVARRHGVAPNQLFTWRRLVARQPDRGRQTGFTLWYVVGLLSLGPEPRVWW
jgi:transposase-like protein